MISWFFIGFLVVLYTLWDLSYREGVKGTTTNGDIVCAAIFLTIFGPISIPWVLIYELERAGIFSKLKDWWNRSVK